MRIVVRHNNTEIVFEDDKSKSFNDYNEYTERTIKLISAICKEVKSLTHA